MKSSSLTRITESAKTSVLATQTAGSLTAGTRALVTKVSLVFELKSGDINELKQDTSGMKTASASILTSVLPGHTLATSMPNVSICTVRTRASVTMDSRAMGRFVPRGLQF